MKKFLVLLSFVSLAVFAEKGGGGSTRGNGGGSRHLQEFLFPLQQSFGELSAIDLSDRVNAFFESSHNLDCDILQNYFSMGIGLVEFYRDSGFEFRDIDGKVIDLSGLKTAELRKKYSEPGACVDKTLNPNGKALLEITDELPPADYEQDLMALNYEDTGKLDVFRKNWKPSEVLKRESCRNLGTDLQTSRALQRSCLFVTHLTVAMHEILSLAGIKQERTKRYDISSHFATLATLNKKEPDPKARKLITHLMQHYLDSFAKLEHFDRKASDLAGKLTKAPYLQGEELKKAYEAWKPAFFDLNLIATRFRVAYFNINIFLEFIIPNSYVPYRKYVEEYKVKYLTVATPRLGFMGLIRDSRVEKLINKEYTFIVSADLQRALFEMSFFSDLVLGEAFEDSADIYEVNKSLPHEVLTTKKTADEIKDWGCKQFPGLNGKKNFKDGR